MRGFYLIWLTSQEKNYNKTQRFTLILLIIFAPCCRQNNGIACHPHSPLVTHPPHATHHSGRLFLVGCCVLVRRLAADLRHRVFYFNYFCIAPFNVPNDGIAFPPALQPPQATSPDSLPSLMPTLGWLLCFPFKFWPLKANATPLALFFDGVCIGIPNKGTGRGTAKPDQG